MPEVRHRVLGTELTAKSAQAKLVMVGSVLQDRAGYVRTVDLARRRVLQMVGLAIDTARRKCSWKCFDFLPFGGGSTVPPPCAETCCGGC